MIFLDRLLINLTGRDTNQWLGCDPDVLWDFETGNLSEPTTVTIDVTAYPAAADEYWMSASTTSLTTESVALQTTVVAADGGSRLPRLVFGVVPVCGWLGAARIWRWAQGIAWER